MKIRMMEFNVLVDQDKTEEKTAGGLYLSQDVQERGKHQQTFGTIIDVAPLAFNEDIWPPDMERPKPGDRVMFAQHAGTFAKFDGKEYRVIKDRDVVAVIA